MNLTNMMKILREKERRVERQKGLLRTCDCLVSYSLNIPGPVKTAALYRILFEEGVRELEEKLSEKACAAGEFRLLPGETEKTPAGHLFLLPIKAADGSCCDARALAMTVKSVTVGIENGTPSGRLFDMDVLFSDGKDPAGEDGKLPEEPPVKVSRTSLGLPGRTCLLCGKEVFSCLRSGRHRVPEVMMTVVDIILESPEVQKKLFKKTEDFLSLLPEGYTGPGCRMLSAEEQKTSEETALRALKALLYEVIVTPKPGLVDTENNGSHRDMEITTFFDSAVAIAPYLLAAAEAGKLLSEEKPEDVLEKIRPLGLLAEKKMYQATGGVNTHKGAIFTMGVVLCACGMLSGRGTPEEILSLSGRICRSMPNGSRGVRTEAMNGYPSVKRALSDFREYLERTAESAGNRATSDPERVAGEVFNEAAVHTLLSLISVVDDENIGRRCMCDGKVWARDRAAYLLRQGFRGEALLYAVSDLDREFILRNASPGGSADLLALTFFFGAFQVTGDLFNKAAGSA